MRSAGIRRIPDAFRAENNQNGVFNEAGAFWLCNWVANMVYPRWSALVGDLVAVREELETGFLGKQAEIEEKTASLTPQEREAYLEKVTFSCVDTMMLRWKQLAHTLIVKYNDEPGSWDQPFYDAIAEQTGERYLVPKQ